MLTYPALAMFYERRSSMTPLIGQPVPDIIFDSSDGLGKRLSDLRGRPVILYFYPKDNTSGCTCEAEDFRDNYNKFQKLNAVILGISRDTLGSHRKFIEKLQLPFALISDKNENLCQLFQVIKPKTMYGKPVRGIERSTFLIDSNGILHQEWRGVKVEGHAAAVLAAMPPLM
jgi:thioredoxin-dependent peroxiredoxin